MSIWCSWPTVGHDDESDGGNVRSYATGWSNHFPTDDFERESSMDLATIAPWCVPGHHDSDGEQGEVGPWLRLGMVTWRHDFHNPKRRPTKQLDAAVVMDEAAVRLLRDQLTTWLELPKLHPRQCDLTTCDDVLYGHHQ